MIKNYFKTAWRNIARNKAYSSINIIGLSLGLTCAMLIMLYVKDEISYDRFHKQVDNVYRVVNKNIKPDGSVENINGFSGYFQGPKFAAGIPEIQHFVRYRESYKDLKTGAEIQSQVVYETDSVFFSVFSFPMISGNPATALKHPNGVVVSEEFAKKKFGNTNPMGKTLLFKNEDKFEPYVVTGVTKKCPQNSSIKFEVLMPLKVSKQDEANNENWFNFFMNTFVLLKPGTNLPLVVAKMKSVYEADAQETIKMIKEKYDVKTKAVYFLQPFTEMHLSKELSASNGLTDSSNPVYSYILTGIAIFILLIACINFVNLTVARSIKRAKEIGIRKVVGGNRKQLIIQFLGESFILCFIAFAMAVLLVQLTLPVFNQLSNKALALSYLFDIKLVTGYIVLFLLTGFLAGFYPALVLSGYNPVHTLYSRFVLGGKNYLQRSLVVLQFALASFLIIATLTVFYQFNYLTSQDIGYDDSNLIVVDKWGIRRSEAKLFKEELLKNPNIIDVAPKNGGMWGTVAKINGDDMQIDFAYETVDENYLPLLKIPVVKGRNFSKDFPSDSTRSVLVNETFVQKAGWKEPIGQEVNFWYNEGEKYTVIGVVKDHHFESLGKKIGSQLFTMKPGNNYGKALIKIKPNTETASLQHIEKVFKKLFPISPYSYKFRDQENLKSYEAEAKWKQIMLFSAILTIFISCFGLFGLSVLSAEKRAKEVGIRKVLGASVSGVVTILSKDFLRLVTIALTIAIPVSWFAANKWLENYPYRITLSWGLFALAALLVVLIALLTVSFQAIKAAVANPVKSLRTE
jgi:putative ABC transport system permease protein